MAKKKNTLTPFVQEVQRALALANFAASTSDGSAKRDKARIRKVIESGNQQALISMAALIGCDTRETDPKKTVAVDFGGQMVTGGDTLLLIDESNSNTQASAIVDSYEAMERFMKKLTAEYLYAKRGQVPILQKDRRFMQRRFGGKAAAENTKPYFSQIAHVLARRNCDPLFGILFKHVDGLRERVRSGHFGDYHDIHQSIQFIRHCKTHANGCYDAEELSKQPARTQEIVKSCIQKSVVHGDDRILPTHKATKDLLAREAEYSQILYDALSNVMQMKVDYSPS